MQERCTTCGSTITVDIAILIERGEAVLTLRHSGSVGTRRVWLSDSETEKTTKLKFALHQLVEEAHRKENK